MTVITNRKIALERMTTLETTITAMQTDKSIMVWHDDGSIFKYSCCYFEEMGDYLIVIPEHHEPSVFHKDEIEWVIDPRNS